MISRKVGKLSSRKSDIFLMIFVIAGLALAGLWTNAIGYGSLPDTDSSSIQPDGVNAAYFVGTILCGVYFLLVKRMNFSHVSLIGAVSFSVVGILLSIGDFSNLKDLAYYAKLIGGGIIGFEHLWFVAHLYYILARRTSLPKAILAIAISLLAEIALTPLIAAGFSLLLYVGTALISPVLIAICIHLTKPQSKTSSLEKEHQEENNEQISSSYKHAKSVRISQIIVAVAAVVVMQALTLPGPWGGSFAKSAQAGYEPVELGLGLVLFAICALLLFKLVRVETSARTPFRLVSAFALLVTGFFVIALSESVGMQQSAVTHSVEIATEGYSHLLLWMLVVGMVGEYKDEEALKAFGTVGLCHGLLSLIFILLLQNLNGIATTLLFVGIYGVFMLFVASTKNANAAVSDPAAAPPSKQTVQDRIDAMAKAYGLSAREADVLALLIEGKSRSQIAKELFISENTVKTHTAHIYKKMGVTTRGELFARISNPSIS